MAEHSRQPGVRHHRSTLRGALSAVALAVAAGLCPCLSSHLSSCFAQDEPEPNVNDYLPSTQPEPTREEWRQRIEAARRRADETAREQREHPELYAPIPQDAERIATERVLNDESLQPGDIVATKKGMFVYQGRSARPRRREDFVPVEPKPER